MTEYVLKAYEEDIRIRLRDKELLGVPDRMEGYKVRAHEIKPGVIYKDENVTVKAFLVNHVTSRRPSATASKLRTARS